MHVKETHEMIAECLTKYKGEEVVDAVDEWRKRLVVYGEKYNFEKQESEAGNEEKKKGGSGEKTEGGNEKEEGNEVKLTQSQKKMVVSQFDSTPFRITSSMWPEIIKEIEKAEQVASSKKDGADHGVGGEEEKDAGGEKVKDGKPDGETTKKGGEDANEPPKGESDTAGQPAKKEGNEAAGQPAQQGEVFKTPEKEPKKDSEKQEFIGEDLNAGDQKKSKRTTHPAEPLCSPYMQRVVQIKTKTEKIEVRIAEWMFSTVDDPW